MHLSNSNTSCSACILSSVPNDFSSQESISVKADISTSLKDIFMFFSFVLSHSENYPQFSSML